MAKKAPEQRGGGRGAERSASARGGGAKGGGGEPGEEARGGRGNQGSKGQPGGVPKGLQGKQFTYTPPVGSPNPAGLVEMIEKSGRGAYRVRFVEEGPSKGVEFGVRRNELEGLPDDEDAEEPGGTSTTVG